MTLILDIPLSHIAEDSHSRDVVGYGAIDEDEKLLKSVVIFPPVDVKHPNP